ncbi:MAG: flagellar assembly protein FliW [Spirochaetales bacterium]|jgi:flagellar assembly factor FliW|nr:flagellar assembly protein FliW [Spirochaetales bacterium]
MIEINTKAQDKVLVDERQLLNFPRGILGFENFHSFALLDSSQAPFYWLQSLDVKEIAFVLIDPTIFRPDYRLHLEEEEAKEVGLPAYPHENGLLFAIVTIPENQARMTANLLGPLVINRQTKTGGQFINNDSQYKTRHFILEELENFRTKTC